MGRIDDILLQMRRTPTDVRFDDLGILCDHYFGEPQQAVISHRIYETLWPADPRVNIQSKKGKAGAYQVRQVLKAVARLESEHAAEG